MARIWVSDFRINTIQDVLRRSERGIDNMYDMFFCADMAEYYWFSTVAINQFVAELAEKSSVILMLGFVDCMNSCVWQTFDIKKIAAKYVKTINELVSQHTGIDFYFCSIPPIDAGYPFYGHKDNIISSKELNEQIMQFNTAAKDACLATYIDCNAYLAATGFSTTDGVRYSTSTAESILSYINIYSDATKVGKDFIPKLTWPKEENNYSDNTVFWRSTEYDGLNPFYGLTNHTGERYTGDTLPNSTAYAWGRFYEILGDQPKLSTDKVELWYANSADGYKRGQEPALGAIMCWSGTASVNTDGKGGRGHVAIVEQINDDGSVVTSESGWNDSRYWWTTKRVKGDDENWGLGSAYTFQGFIYNPAVTLTPTAVYVTKEQVTSSNETLLRYVKGTKFWDPAQWTPEIKLNAKYIWGYLGSRGWSLNAVAGMLGNMQRESSINPGRHQVGGSGYGLVQWTPKSNLTNWTNANGYKEDDIDGQLEKIINERDTGKQYYKNHYKYTFKEFSTSTDDPYTLACAFAFDYERSAVVLWGAHSRKQADQLSEAEKEANREALRQERGKAAEAWYKYLSPYGTITASEEKSLVSGFKIDKVLPTSVKASVITKNSKSGRYEILDTSGKLLHNESLDITTSKNLLQIISFSYGKLEPKTKYVLLLEFCANNDNKNSRKVEFTTPQDYPEHVKDIELTCQDTIKSINSKFKLKVTKPEYLGYWKSDSGYELQLIVNGKIVKTKTIKEVKDISESFTIKEKFNYNCHVGDTIQIGIMVWTKDDTGEYLYNDNSKIAKTSKPICLLNKPVLAYLNID